MSDEPPPIPPDEFADDDHVPSVPLSLSFQPPVVTEPRFGNDTEARDVRELQELAHVSPRQRPEQTAPVPPPYDEKAAAKGWDELKITYLRAPPKREAPSPPKAQEEDANEDDDDRDAYEKFVHAHQRHRPSTPRKRRPPKSARINDVAALDDDLFDEVSEAVLDDIENRTKVAASRVPVVDRKVFTLVRRQLPEIAEFRAEQRLRPHKTRRYRELPVRREQLVRTVRERVLRDVRHGGQRRKLKKTGHADRHARRRAEWFGRDEDGKVIRLRIGEKEAATDDVPEDGDFWAGVRAKTESVEERKAQRAARRRERERELERKQRALEKKKAALRK